MTIGQTNTNAAPDTSTKGLMPTLLVILVAALVSASFDLSGPTTGILLLVGWLVVWAYYLGDSANKATYLRSTWKFLTVLATIGVLLGLASIAKSSLDMTTAGNPCYTAAEYPTCYPSVAKVKANLFGGLWILGGSLLVAVPGLIRFRASINDFFKKNDEA